MRTSRSVLSLLIAASLIAEPMSASARPGGAFRSSGARPSSTFGAARSAPRGGLTYQSQGSRGARTSAPVSGAQSITRSQNSFPGTVSNNNAGLGNSVSRSPQLVTPAHTPSYPAAPAPAQAHTGQGWSAPSTAPSFAQRHPVVTGLLAGAAGSYLYNHIANSGSPAVANGGGFANQAGLSGSTGAQSAPAYAGGQGEGLGLLGFLLRMGLLAGVVYAVVAFWRRARGRRDDDNQSAAFSTQPQAAVEAGYSVTEDDKKVFKALLQEINGAWSRGDLNALQMYISPEMVQYYKEPLDGNASQGVRNIVENVHDIQVQPLESWREGPVAYATCRMRWASLDYMVNLRLTSTDPDYVVDGSRSVPTVAEEIWTFGRHVDGDWILTAIQQTT